MRSLAFTFGLSYHRGRPVTPYQQAVLLNALPLLGVAGAYVAAAVRRGRSAEGPGAALALTAAAFAAALLALLVLLERAPLAGNALVSLLAVLAAAVPAVALLVRPRERDERSRGAVEPAAVVAGALADLDRANSDRGVARVLVTAAQALLDVEFAGLWAVEERRARGVLARNGVDEVSWWVGTELDLEQEPSTVASVVFEGAPVTLYDLAGAGEVNQRVAELVGARRGAFVPLVAADSVVGVLELATAREQRAFPPTDLERLHELTAAAAVALVRAHPAPGAARDGAAGVAARLAASLRAYADVELALQAAADEVVAATGADRCTLAVAGPGALAPVRAHAAAPGLAPLEPSTARLALAEAREEAVLADVEAAAELEPAARAALARAGTRALLVTPLTAGGTVLGTLALHRTEPGPWPVETRAAAEAAAGEIALVLRTARLLEENERRLAQQTALLQAARVVTSELDLEAVLRRLVEEVVPLVGADAADCWIFEGDGLRLRAAHGLSPAELGRRIRPEGTIGRAIESGRPVLKREFAATEDPPPSATYRVFAEVMDAPIATDGVVRGVLGVCARDAGTFSAADLDLLEAFATLASLALRNAEAYEERTRQAGIERGFYRIAAVLGRSISLAETLDAVAQVAAETLGGDYAALLLSRGGVLELAGAQALPEPIADALRAGVPESEAALHAATSDRRLLAAATVVEDTRFGTEWRELASRAGYRSLLAIPTEAPGQPDPKGLVLVFFAEERVFVEDDLELARHLADAARGALERSALFEHERTARSLAQQLARTGSILAELDPAAVLDEVVRQAPRLIDVDACAIRVLDDAELVVTAAHGPGSEAAIATRSPATAWLSGDVVQSGRPVTVEDAAGDERLRGVDAVLDAGYRGYLGVPLSAAEGALHGVLAVYSQRPRSWRPEEVEALRALAANASAALANAELYQRVAIAKEQADAILSNIADAIVAVDREGLVVLWNRAAEEITGVPASEALGRTPQRVLQRDLAGAGAGDRLLSIRRGGEEVWLSLTEAVMRDPAGAIAGRIYAFRDISSDRLVEQMKSEFVSTVSQELRRPLTSIYGFAETLLRRDVVFGEEERRTFLEYIASESERLAVIVDALLNVARLDSGDLHVTLAPTDVATVVEEVVEDVQAAHSGNGHRFVVDVPSEPVTAEADAEKLRQILGVLVDNAVKYSPDGGTVTVAARPRERTVEVTVADEGVGIPQAERERIFRKFYRGDSTAGRAVGTGGTGLGLFIAQGLVGAMGGRIWVSSEEGRGSQFTFELPRARDGAGSIS